MKMLPRPTTLVAAALAASLCSCATVKESMSATAGKVSKLGELASEKIRPAQIPVVEVREQDLKELPTGEERALAYENTRRHRSWFFSGPVDFVEPSLPTAGGEMDGSLLPPKGP